jgi:hypothetical protein
LEKQILASEAQTIAAKIQAAAADKQLEYFTEAIKHIGKKKSFDDDEPFGRFIP